MSYSNGDRVKITAENSTHTGELGYITNVYADQESLLVKLDEGKELGYFVDEVELVKAADTEADQIYKLTGVLYNEPGNEDWDMEQSHKSAASLYKAGVRFSG